MKTFIVVSVLLAVAACASLDKAATTSKDAAKEEQKAKTHGKRGLIDYGYGYAKEPELQGGFKPSFGYDIASVEEPHYPTHKSFNHHLPNYHQNQYAALYYKEPSSSGTFSWKDEKHTVITKKVPVHIDRPVPYPVEVVKKVPVYIEKQVAVHVDRPVPYPVKVPVEVEKKVPVYVEKKVHVDRPVPYPVKVKVPVYHKVEVEVPKPYPVHIPKPYPVYIEKEVVKHVDRPVPYEVEKKVHVPVIHRVEIEKPYPVYVDRPVLVEKAESHEHSHEQSHEQLQEPHSHEHSHELQHSSQEQSHELHSHEQEHAAVHHNIRPVGIKATDFISEPIHVHAEHEQHYGEESQKIERKVEQEQQQSGSEAATLDHPASASSDKKSSDSESSQ
ncbi:involucrin-like [Anopheles albimanus]|uniref:Cuticular protein (putative) n=1 Tax=Anopheles albimanus TaxID=7167 RepID=A0A182F5T3_ANOAL|nr:involucrin-like [Anopheles albimanus]